MEQDLTEEELQELERQLKCPSGDFGIEVAETMNETNIGMTMETIKTMNIADRDNILEVGHGNCFHLKEILNTANHVQYTGLDISALMKKEAERINDEFINEGRAKFVLYDGKDIPFAANTFDKIFSVNTLYFWNEPLAFLSELCRVLKKGGRLSITYGLKGFMKKLPFVRDVFQLYSIIDVKQLVTESDLELVEILRKSELIESNSGDEVQRKYAIAILQKPEAED